MGIHLREKIEHRFTPWNKVKFEFLLNIDNTIPRGERTKTDLPTACLPVGRAGMSSQISF